MVHKSEAVFAPLLPRISEHGTASTRVGAVCSAKPADGGGHHELAANRITGNDLREKPESWDFGIILKAASRVFLEFYVYSTNLALRNEQNSLVTLAEGTSADSINL